MTQNSRYEKRIDFARRTVAILFAICGVGLVISANRLDWWQGVMKRSPAPWVVATSIFGFATQICVVATAALVIESLYRRLKRSPLTIIDFAITGTLAIAVYTATIGILWSFSESDPRKGGPREANQLTSSKPSHEFK